MKNGSRMENPKRLERTWTGDKMENGSSLINPEKMPSLFFVEEKEVTRITPSTSKAPPFVSTPSRKVLLSRLPLPRID